MILDEREVEPQPPQRATSRAVIAAFVAQNPCAAPQDKG
jgi:hypothetical protein